MLVQTNRKFYDVLEDTYRNVGDQFEVTEERYIDLNTKVSGFVSLVKDAKPEAPADDLDNLKVAELKDLLDAKGIDYDSKATKDELKALLQK